MTDVTPLSRYEDLARRFAAVWRGWQLYASHHPLQQRNIDQLLDTLTGLHAEREAIALGVVGAQIVVADTPLPKAAANLAELLKRLKTAGIERIGFDRGVTRDELNDFIDAIATLTQRRDAGTDTLPEFPHINVGRIGAERAETGIARDIAAIKRLYDDASRSAEDLYESTRADGRPELAAARQTVEGLAESVAQNRTALVALTAMKSYDNYTFTHMVNVSILAMAQARALGIEGQRLREFGLSALMHDIGEVRTPIEILQKTDRLTEDEFTIMKRHVVDGAEILRQTPEMPTMAPSVAFEHHLRIDGSGYPEIKRTPLNLATMLTSIADVYDAMRSQRAYQQAFPTDRILAVMKRNDGTEFDQNLVRRFVQLIGIYPPRHTRATGYQRGGHRAAGPRTGPTPATGTGAPRSRGASDPLPTYPTPLGDGRRRRHPRHGSARPGRLRHRSVGISLMQLLKETGGRRSLKASPASTAPRGASQQQGPVMRLACSTCFGVLVALAVLLVQPLPAQTPALPSPAAFFGFPMGAEGELAGWNRMVEYFARIGDESDRVLVEELGPTTNGNPYLLLTISAPETIADLPRYRAMQHRLADPRRTSERDASTIAETGKAVLLIGANVHATEIGTSQAMNTLVHFLATDTSAWTRRVLDNVVILVIPSENPDGQQMVVDWHYRNRGTPYERSPLPELYHPYAGHDNNRDSYMLTQVETRYLNQVLYRDWIPEVYLDTHQMGSSLARIFVPPFKNPPNPNVDPLVWSEVNLLGQAMAAKLHETGKTGIIWGELYSAFWQGANNTNPWWHNQIALLTEVASAGLATTIRQERVDREQWAGADAPGDRGPSRGDSPPPAPAPTDVQYRMTYPRPWLGGDWSPADVVDYSLTAVFGLIEAVANNRTPLKRNFYTMNRRAIARFSEGRPFAFIIPREQPDPGAVAKLLSLLQAEAAEVHVADAPFTAAGQTYAAGTHVVLLAQPVGRWVKDLLEPQRYPDIRWPFADAPMDRPYDVTAWSLGMLMGVDTLLVDEPFEASLRLAELAITAPEGRVTGSGSTYVLPHSVNASFRAMNRLLHAGADVQWTDGDLATGDAVVPHGAILVSAVDRATVETLATDLRLQIQAVTPESGWPLLPIDTPRLGVYEPWGGNMDTGWTRWVLDQHEFAYSRLRAADIRAGELGERFDVLVFAEMTSADVVRGLQDRNVRPEYRGGIGAIGVQHLQDFVNSGGTIITLGNAATFAIEQLGVPLVNTLRDTPRDAFYAPGSILRVEVDPTHPIGFGMPTDADVMFVNNGAYATASKLGTRATPVVAARYPDRPLLRSGWITGEDQLRGSAAVIEAPVGRGRVILHTFRVQHRGQTWGTFRLLFNSIFYGPAATDRPAPMTTLEQQQ